MNLPHCRHTATHGAIYEGQRQPGTGARPRGIHLARAAARCLEPGIVVQPHQIRRPHHRWARGIERVCACVPVTRRDSDDRLTTVGLEDDTARLHAVAALYAARTSADTTG